MRAPRRRATSSASRTRIPAPSASTKPSRSRSNGRLAQGRIVIAGRKRPHRGESAQSHVGDRGLAPAGDHHVGPAGLDQLERITDRVGRRRAGCRHRRARTLQPPADRDLAAGGVDHELGDHERADPRRPLLHHHGVLRLELVEPADPRADHDAALLFGHGREIDPGVFDGRDGGRQRELRESIEMTSFLHAKSGDGVPVANLAAEPDLELGRYRKA